MDGKALANLMENRLTLEEYNAIADDCNKALLQANCTTVPRVAMMGAQVGEESGGLQWRTELASGAEYEWRADLGNIYKGDGVRYKGRSVIQITGRHNYAALSAWAHQKGYVKTSTYFVDNPTELANDEYMFLGFVWYWTIARPQLNTLADNKDIYGATRAVNGGLNGIDDRIQRFNHALTLGSSILPVKPYRPPAFPLKKNKWFGPRGYTGVTSELHRSQIKLIQRRLNLIVKSHLKVDGHYGPETVKAVNAFRRKHHWRADGKIGYLSWTILFRK